MSVTRRPPSEPPPPPDSQTRRTVPDKLFYTLSLDSTAAVLHAARAEFEDERHQRERLSTTSLVIFAGRVRFWANQTREGLYKDGVFIAPLFRFLRARDEATDMPLSAFKARLLQAHHLNLLALESCEKAPQVNPILLAASSLHHGQETFHAVPRWPPRSLPMALSDILDALSPGARAKLAAYARKVRDDEKRRDGRKRLCALSARAFAQRAQEVANETPADMRIATLFWRLEERGEMTGLDLEAFQARLFEAHRAGLLTLTKEGGADFAFLRRTATPAPIPWGPPAKLIRQPRSPSLGV